MDTTAPPGAAPPLAAGRVAAWAGFLFGSAASTAANVLHAWIPKPPEGAPPAWTPAADWAPTAAAQIGAAVWPIALLIAVEVLSRVAWPTTAAWKFARYGGAGTVAVGAAFISYGHVYDVLTAWGYSTLGAAAGPLVLDGLMVVSGFALLAGQHRTVQDQAAGSGHGPARVEPPALNPQSRPGRVEAPPPAPDVPTGMPTPAPAKPQRQRTAAQQQADEVRKAKHAEGDHSACKTRTCRVVRERAAAPRVRAA